MVVGEAAREVPDRATCPRQLTNTEKARESALQRVDAPSHVTDTSTSGLSPSESGGSAQTPVPTHRYLLRRRSKSTCKQAQASDSVDHECSQSTSVHQVNSTRKSKPRHKTPTIAAVRATAEDRSKEPSLTDLSSSPVDPFCPPSASSHVVFPDHGSGSAMSRPRAGRAGTGRDARDGEMVENDLLNRVIEAVKKAKEHNDNCQRLGSQIVELEAEIKAKGSSTPEQHRRLDTLYRDMMRHAEAEKRVHDDEDIVNNLAIIASLKSTDEPPRGGHINKPPRKQRPILESDVIADSPGPSPSDTRVDILKRKGTNQRSSSVASQGRSGNQLKEDVVETNRGVQAEKAGQLVVGTEVFYRFPKGSTDDLGIGIQCIIKKVSSDSKGIMYDVQDPEPDPSGKHDVRRARARDLIPIPSVGTSLPTFPIGTTVYARYPETDTFYKAKVRGHQKGEYTLRFEGEEDDKEQPVEKRFVLDSKMR